MTSTGLAELYHLPSGYIANMILRVRDKWHEKCYLKSWTVSCERAVWENHVPSFISSNHGSRLKQQSQAHSHHVSKGRMWGTKGVPDPLALRSYGPLPPTLSDGWVLRFPLRVHSMDHRQCSLTRTFLSSSSLQFSSSLVGRVTMMFPVSDCTVLTNSAEQEALIWEPMCHRNPEEMW